MRTVFLKLGGSLITDKRQAETTRPEVLGRMAQEIASALKGNADLRLVVGHGSGSFGHFFGRRYNTRAGVHTALDWYGYAATGDAAARLNRLVVQALLAEDVPAWGIQPGATVFCHDGLIQSGPESTVAQALERGLTPVVFGDVALDDVRGGTIVSTEEVFEWLLANMPPEYRARRLVLAGEVDGIYTADPQVDASATLIPEMTPESIASVARGLGESYGVDVTGGMEAKVSQAVNIVQANSGMDVIVCSGLVPGNLTAVLQDAKHVRGTRIHV